MKELLLGIVFGILMGQWSQTEHLQNIEKALNEIKKQGVSK
jgi:hypothetical protein